MASNRITSWLKRIAYALPFGLKGGDNAISTSSQNSLNEGITISQEVNDKRVAKHLLKGEVTQEVEELRYRTYKVAEESENYSYIANGNAIKNKKDKARNKTKFKITQDNHLICASVLHELQRVNDYGTEEYVLQITYDGIVRFKIEQFATRISVDVDESCGKIETTLHFNTDPNPYDAKSMPFINELKKLCKATSPYEIGRSEIASSVRSICFSTYKCEGEKDFTNFAFTDGCTFKESTEKDHEISVTYTWSNYSVIPLNLSEKYFSKTMAEKYEKKERKEAAAQVGDVRRKRYCQVCGKEINVYDGDILEYDNGFVICEECRQKALKNNQ